MVVDARSGRFRGVRFGAGRRRGSVRRRPSSAEQLGLKVCLTDASGIDRARYELEVGPMEASECDQSALIHQATLGMEFLARFGPGFLAEYHRAWVRSPCGLALAARDREGRLVGVMLGSLDPASHYKSMLTQSGPKLAARMVASAATRPRLAYELAVTRSGRYSRALWRHLRARFTLDRRGSGTPSAPSPASGSRIGEITHLMVDPALQRSGAGRALVDRTVELARSEGLGKLVLVTPPDMAARSFYDALGWTAGSEVTSRSGEKFVSYSLLLTSGATGDSST